MHDLLHVRMPLRIEVTLQEGRVRFIKGNRKHPVNQGVLCAKGSAGIMKQYSKAKLTGPMMRKPGAERGAGEFVSISWDEALEMLTKRLAHIRATEPKKLAFFTGRDQMQALTGLWAQQFGTPNWAAHGGFCSVNMGQRGSIRSVIHSGNSARPIGTEPNTLCFGGAKITHRIRSKQDGCRQHCGLMREEMGKA